MRETIKEHVDKWNPIGVDELPDDEYEILVEKIEGWVQEGLRDNDLVFLIDNELQEHFMLDPDYDGVQEFVESLLGALSDEL